MCADLGHPSNRDYLSSPSSYFCMPRAIFQWLKLKMEEFYEETLWDEPFQEEDMIDFVLKDLHQHNLDLPTRYTPRYFGQSGRGVLHWQQQPLQYYLDQEFIWKSTCEWCKVNTLDKFGKVRRMDSHLRQTSRTEALQCCQLSDMESTNPIVKCPFSS